MIHLNGKAFCINMTFIFLDISEENKKEFVEKFEQLNELVLSENKIDLNNNKNSDIIDQIIKLKKKHPNNEHI